MKSSMSGEVSHSIKLISTHVTDVRFFSSMSLFMGSKVTYISKAFTTYVKDIFPPNGMREIYSCLLVIYAGWRQLLDKISFHICHKYKSFSLVWVGLCWMRPLRRVQSFPHMLQIYGFSPIWASAFSARCASRVYRFLLTTWIYSDSPTYVCYSLSRHYTSLDLFQDILYLHFFSCWRMKSMEKQILQYVQVVAVPVKIKCILHTVLHPPENNKWVPYKAKSC